MKKIQYIILAILVIILTWFGSSIMNVKKAKNREGIILSPNKSKSVEIIRSINTTQILMNFHKNFIVGGSNVMSGDFVENEIFIEWQDENNLNLEYPIGAKLNNKEEEIYFFGEIVKVNYKELSGELNTATNK